MNELKHYGVKGMKWGVRKETKSERNTRKRKAQANSFNRFAEQMGSKERVEYVEKGDYYKPSGRDPKSYKSTKLKTLSPAIGDVLVNSKDGDPSDKGIRKAADKIERDSRKEVRAGDEKKKIRKTVGMASLKVNRVFDVINANIDSAILGLFSKDPSFKAFTKQNIDRINDNYRQIGQELMRDGKLMSSMMKRYLAGYTR